MAVTSSAKKALRSSQKKRVFNIRTQKAMKDAVKEVRTLVAAKKKNEASALLPKAYQAVDKAAKTNVISKNTAARYKSRMVAAINKIS